MNSTMLRLFSLCALLVLPTYPLAVYAAEWQSARSGDFLIISNVGKDQTAQVIRSIDLHRIGFAKLMDAPELQPGMPVTVFVLSNAMFARLATNQPRIGGLYYDSEVHPYIAINSDLWVDATQIVYHELTHLLQHRFTDPRALPSWLDEGYAEVLSTIHLTGNEKLQIGLPSADRWRDVKQVLRMPVQQVLLVTPGDRNYTNQFRSRAFYGEAWALVHFWRYSKSKSAAGITRYLELLSAGKTPSEALKTSFTDGGEQLDKDVRDYLRQTTFGYSTYDLPNFPEQRSYQTQIVDLDSDLVAGEIAAWLTNSNPQSPKGLEFLKSYATASKASNAAKLSYALGSMTGRTPNDADFANAELCKSIPQNSTVHRTCGQFLAALATAKPDSTLAAELNRRAYQHFLSAIALDSHDLVALWQATQLQKKSGEDPSVLIRELEATLARNPALAPVAYSLADLYSPTNPTKGVQYVRMGLSHDFVPERVERAREFLKQVDGSSGDVSRKSN